MSNRYLVSVTTPNYVPKASQYLKTLPLVTSAQSVLILLDFNEQTDHDGKVESDLRRQLDWVEFRKMPLPASHSHYMVQHCFMDALPDVPDDALVILTDMDITIQRDLSASEWDFLERLTPDQIGAYWNGTSLDNLQLEAERIGLTDDWKRRRAPDDLLATLPCYNCGVMVARASVFRFLKTIYESFCDDYYQHTSHRSRCQMLINWCWWMMSLQVVTLPGTVHQHGHFKVPETGEYVMEKGTHARLDTIMFDGQPVVFKHAF